MFFFELHKNKIEIEKKITHAFKLLCVGGWSTRAQLLEWVTPCRHAPRRRSTAAHRSSSSPRRSGGSSRR